MTDNNNEVFETPKSDLPQRKSGCLFKGCLSLVAFVVLMIGGCGLILYSQQKKVIPICEYYFSAMEAGNYISVYNGFGPEWKKEQTQDEFIQFASFLSNNLGKLNGMNMMGLTVNSYNGITTAVANYSTHYENGDAQVVFTLKKYNGEYLIDGVKYNSDRLINASKCSKCGSKQASMSKFCSSCGNELSQ